MTKIITKIISFIVPFLPKILEFLNGRKSEKNIVAIEEKEQKETIRYIKNILAQRKALVYLKKNIKAHYRGRQKWKGGIFNGKKYNNVLYHYDASPGRPNLIIYRNYAFGEYHFVGSVETSKDIKPGGPTYCNLLISAWFKFYYYEGTNSLQDYNGKQIGDNTMFRYFSKGVYDFGGCGFSEVKPQKAGKIARSGGFVIVGWYNPTGDDHFAMMLDTNKIFQAGITCGEMTVNAGFGAGKKLRYWSFSKSS